MNLNLSSRRVRRTLQVLTPFIGLAVATTLVTTLAPATTAGASAQSGPVGLRVASFNIQSVGVDQSSGMRRPWRERRGTVIAQILGQRVDVIGVQEANPGRSFGHRLVGGPNQYLDLRNGLNAAGGTYALANKHGYNCRRSTTAYKCRYRARGASGSERILYNTQTVKLLRSGAMRYHHQGSGRKNVSYLAYAWFRSKVNGSKFLFTSTHLDPRHRGVRKGQWRELIRKVKRMKHGHPVVNVGDFNTQKFDRMARSMLPAMKRAGFGDTLSQKYRTNPIRHVRAKHRINTWVNSYNHLSADVRRFGYTDRHDKIGNSIDYIFASNRLKVWEYEVVLNFNPYNLQVNGILPSDHNMIRATIAIP